MEVAEEIAMNERALVHAAYQWLSVAAVAERIGASPEFVRDRIHRRIAGFRFEGVLKIGREYRIPPTEVERFIEANTVKEDAA